mgnify:FL=1
MKIFHVLHHEIFYTGGIVEYRADEMLFHTCSTLKNAIKYIKTSSVEPWSWWEIQEHRVDHQDWPSHFAYYDYRGRKIDSPPYDASVKMYKRKCKLKWK